MESMPMPRRSFSCATFLLMLTTMFVPRREEGAFALAAKTSKPTEIPLTMGPLILGDGSIQILDISATATIEIPETTASPTSIEAPRLTNRFGGVAPNNLFWRLENDIPNPDNAIVAQWLTENFRKADYSLYPYMDEKAQLHFKKVLATRALKRPEYLQRLTKILLKAKTLSLSSEEFEALSRELRYFSRDYADPDLLKWVIAQAGKDDVEDWHKIASTYLLEHMSGILFDALPPQGIATAKGFLPHYIYYFFALLPQRLPEDELNSIAAIYWEEMHGDAYVRASGQAIETVISTTTGESFIELACKKYPFIAARIFAIMKESGVVINYPTRLAMLQVSQNRNLSEAADSLVKEVLPARGESPQTFIQSVLNDAFENFQSHLVIAPDAGGGTHWVKQIAPLYGSFFAEINYIKELAEKLGTEINWATKTGESWPMRLLSIYYPPADPDEIKRYVELFDHLINKFDYQAGKLYGGKHPDTLVGKAFALLNLPLVEHFKEWPRTQFLNAQDSSGRTVLMSSIVRAKGFGASTPMFDNFITWALKNAAELAIDFKLKDGQGFSLTEYIKFYAPQYNAFIPEARHIQLPLITPAPHTAEGPDSFEFNVKVGTTVALVLSVIIIGYVNYVTSSEIKKDKPTADKWFRDFSNIKKIKEMGAWKRYEMGSYGNKIITDFSLIRPYFRYVLEKGSQANFDRLTEIFGNAKNNENRYAEQAQIFFDEDPKNPGHGVIIIGFRCNPLDAETHQKEFLHNRRLNDEACARLKELTGQNWSIVIDKPWCYILTLTPEVSTEVVLAVLKNNYGAQAFVIEETPSELRIRFHYAPKQYEGNQRARHVPAEKVANSSSASGTNNSADPAVNKTDSPAVEKSAPIAIAGADFSASVSSIVDKDVTVSRPKRGVKPNPHAEARARKEREALEAEKEARYQALKMLISRTDKISESRVSQIKALQLAHQEVNEIAHNLTNDDSKLIEAQDNIAHKFAVIINTVSSELTAIKERFVKLKGDMRSTPVDKITRLQEMLAELKALDEVILLLQNEELTRDSKKGFALLESYLGELRQPFVNEINVLIPSLKALISMSLSPEQKTLAMQQKMAAAKKAWESMSIEPWEEQESYVSAQALVKEVLVKHIWPASVISCSQQISSNVRGEGRVPLEINFAPWALHYHLFRLFELLKNHHNPEIQRQAGQIRHHLVHCHAQIANKGGYEYLKSLAKYFIDWEALSAEVTDNDSKAFGERIHRAYTFHFKIFTIPEEGFIDLRHSDVLFNDFKAALENLQLIYDFIEICLAEHEGEKNDLTRQDILKEYPDLYATANMLVLVLVESCNAKNADYLNRSIIAKCEIEAERWGLMLKSLTLLRNEAAHKVDTAKVEIRAGREEYVIEAEIPAKHHFGDGIVRRVYEMAKGKLFDAKPTLSGSASSVVLHGVFSNKAVKDEAPMSGVVASVWAAAGAGVSAEHATDRRPNTRF